MRRRQFLKSAAASMASGVASSSVSALAQTTLSIDQKADLARTWGLLQALQDSRTAVPTTPRAFGVDPMLKLLKSVSNDRDLSLVTFELWHKLALDLTAVDHSTSTKPDLPALDIYAEQFGPHKTSRAMAMIHLAMFEALNIFRNRYSTYKSSATDPGIRSNALLLSHLGPADIVEKPGALSAAISWAALEVTRALYPKKKVFIKTRADEIFKDVRGEGIAIGRAVGQSVAAVVLKMRGWSETDVFSDGSEFPEPLASNFMSSDFRKWRPDPISGTATAVGGMWSHVTPFVLPGADAFRCPPPPAFDSSEFKEGFEEVKSLGGWGEAYPSDPDSGRWATKTDRKGDINNVDQGNYQENESFKAIFWGYDGTAYLCAPPRLYLQLAMTYARTKLKFGDAYELSRYLAMISLAMVDAGISAWEAKYFYLLPRPVTFIRNVDGISTLQGDSKWTPLGAAVTNAGLPGRNVTPPFPSYPSGHAVFGGALFEILRAFAIAQSVTEPAFSFISDEFNGKNYSPGASQARPEISATYRDLAAAELENGQSRIWMGIHWKVDRVEGTKQGNRIGKYVMDKVFLKLND